MASVKEYNTRAIHVGVNAHLLSMAANYRSAGINWYIQNLLQHLPGADPGFRYTVFAGERAYPGAAGLALSFTRLPTHRPAVRFVWEQAVQPWALWREDIDLLHCPALVGPMLVVHLIHDVRDAMGANAVNTACEAIAPDLESLSGGRVGLRILSNLADQRLARARCRVPATALALEGLSPAEGVQRILEAQAFAEADPYRATTHNKGIMNGIDAVALATGNDWRAIEAGAHAYAARGGRYRPLSRWERDERGDLVGRIELPMAAGTFGGATRAHPTAQLSLAILGVETSQELAQVLAAVGLAQNLAALRALAMEGIQRGHMRLHARQVAMAAGASAGQIDQVAQRMVQEGTVRSDRAEAILKELLHG